MKTYSYQCKDYSLLTPLFKKLFVAPLVNYISFWLPANYITILSNTFFYFGLYLSYKTDSLAKTSFLIIPILLFAYLVGDHLDGAQAKKTNTGSPLGEFCDHFLDAFNTGILIIIMVNLFDINNNVIISMTILTAYWAHVVVFYEQYKSGWLIFEKIGSLEGMILAIVILLLGYIENVNNLYHFTINVLSVEFKIIEIIILIISFASIITTTKTLYRIKKKSLHIGLYFVSTVILLFCGLEIMDIKPLLYIFILYNGLFLGRTILQYLIAGKEHVTDLFIPLYFIFNYFFSNFFPNNLHYAPIFYLIMLLILLIFDVYKHFKKYWLWINPKN